MLLLTSFLLKKTREVLSNFEQRQEWYWLCESSSYFCCWALTSGITLCWANAQKKKKGNLKNCWQSQVKSITHSLGTTWFCICAFLMNLPLALCCGHGVAVVPIFLGSRYRHVSSSDMGRKKRGIAVHNWEKLVKSLRNILCSSVWTSFLLIFHLHAHTLSKFLPSSGLACDFSSCFLGLLAVACSKIQLRAWGFIRK